MTKRPLNMQTVLIVLVMGGIVFAGWKYYTHESNLTVPDTPQTVDIQNSDTENVVMEDKGKNEDEGHPCQQRIF